MILEMNWWIWIMNHCMNTLEMDWNEQDWNDIEWMNLDDSQGYDLNETLAWIPKAWIMGGSKPNQWEWCMVQNIDQLRITCINGQWNCMNQWAYGHTLDVPWNRA